MFRLLRYFSVASFFAFLVVTILLGFLYRRTAMQELIAQEERKNMAVTQALANSLQPQLLAYLAATDGLSGDDLRMHPSLAALRSEIETKMAGLSVAKIKIYNQAGGTIFSTEDHQIGEDTGPNAGFQAARAGEIASELTHRDTFSTFDGVLENQDVLSTYLPVRFGGSTGSVEGVFELYSTVTPLLDRINTTQRTIVVGVALILAVLYLVLFLIVKHADDIIRRQYREHVQAEEELRRQQHALAVLRERERLARDLHDSVGQVLGYLNVQAQAVSARWSQGQVHDAHRLLLRLVEIVQSAQIDVRKQILALRSGAAHGSDFPGVPEENWVKLCGDGQSQGEPAAGLTGQNRATDHEVEVHLLRIVQEALTNVRKHAQAKHAWIQLDLDDRRATVTIADDGKGFQPDHTQLEKGLHFGLQMMHGRAAEIGGGVQVQSAPGQGTRVTVQVPLAEAGREGESWA